MATRSFLYTSLAVLLVVALSNYGVHCGDEDDEDQGPTCPDVETLLCSQNQPAPAGCRKTAVITLEDGTECPGCQFCIEDGIISVGREFGRACPPIACPPVQLPENCNATTYEQKAELMGVDCDLCQTAAC